MTLANLIRENGVVVDVPADSRKQALNFAANLAEHVFNIPAQPLLDAVTEREKLGSTGVGDGVAIPHARTDLVKHVCGVFIRLSQAVDFDSVDGQPADLIFLLIAPHDAGAEHLKALAQVARLFRRQRVRTAIRVAPDSAAIMRILTSDISTNAA